MRPFNAARAFPFAKAWRTPLEARPDQPCAPALKVVQAPSRDDDDPPTSLSIKRRLPPCCPRASKSISSTNRRIVKIWHSPIEKAGEEDVDWLLELATKLEPIVGAAFIDAVLNLRNSPDSKRLRDALEARDVKRVLEALGDADLQARILSRVVDPLGYLVTAGADGGLDAADLTMTFDLSNPEAIKAVRGYGFDLIRQITDDTRAGIRQIVGDAIAFGGHPYEQARQIRSLIGLTDSQAQAVANFRRFLQDGDRAALTRELRDRRFDPTLERALGDNPTVDLAPEQIDTMVGRYASRMLDFRAKNIARTETINALNLGQLLGWKQARENGLIDDGARRFWVVTRDDRLCPECAAVPGMNPDGVGLDEDFDTPYGPMDGPTLHPQCRCTEIIRTGAAKRDTWPVTSKPANRRKPSQWILLGLGDQFSKYDEEQPRVPAGSPQGGQFSSAGGVGVRVDPKTGTMLTKDGKPIVVRTLDEAVQKLQGGEGVMFNRPKEAVTFLHRLRDIALDAKAKGEAAPVYNLCGVYVAGTNLFCSESLRIPRSQMPQLSGVPIKGSPADALDKNKKGEVDLGKQFRAYLRDKGVSVEKDKVAPSMLRAAQNQLDGAKVASIMGKFEEHGADPSRIFVSRENYIVDGHHHWAAEVGLSLSGDDTPIRVWRVDMAAPKLLKEANDFTRHMGIAPRALGKRLAKFNPNHDEKGEFATGGGIGGGVNPKAVASPGPLDKDFNDACKAMAAKTFPKGFDVSATAPNTFEDLKAHVGKTGRMVVWSGGSDKTIFADPEANYAFRAWHDSCHLRGDHPFTPEGELGAYQEMVGDVHAAYGNTPAEKRMIVLLHEEIVGQLRYTAAHGGNFPVDQRGFAGAYLKDPQAAIHATFKRASHGGAGAWGRFRDVRPGENVVALVERALSGFEKFNAYHDEHGRFTSAPVGVAFASPNTKTLVFVEAGQQMRSPRQSAMSQAAAEIDRAMGLKATHVNAVGAWEDGAENTVVTEWHGGAWEQMRAAEAMKGALANQKAVLVFQRQGGGPDIMAQFRAQGTLAEIHARLLEDGIAFHTLVPTSDGARVMVFDQGGTRGEDIGKAAARYGSKVSITQGRGEYLGTKLEGGSDIAERADAQRVYSEVISSARGESDSGPSIFGRVRNRWSAAISKALSARRSAVPEQALPDFELS